MAATAPQPKPNGTAERARATGPRDVKHATLTPGEAKQIETLKQRLAKQILDFGQQLEKPWQKMNEKEQQRVIDRTQHLAGELVNEAVTTMASRGFPHFTVQVGKITIDKGIKADFTLPTSQAVLDALIAGKNQTMMLVARNEKQFHAGGKPPTPDVVGDLALPKTGKGAPSDEEAIAQVGRGNKKAPLPTEQPQPPAAA